MVCVCACKCVQVCVCVISFWEVCFLEVRQGDAGTGRRACMYVWI